jgi:hypothetical protein
MRVSLAILFSAMATSSAFSPVPRSPTANPITGLHMSSPVKVPITITGDNVDLTTALSDYVNLKVDRTLGKLSSVSGVSHCDVFLTVNKNPKVNILSEWWAADGWCLWRGKARGCILIWLFPALGMFWVSFVWLGYSQHCQPSIFLNFCRRLRIATLPRSWLRWRAPHSVSLKPPPTCMLLLTW